MNIYDHNWQKTYELGQMLNKYPFDLLVSLTLRLFSKVPDRSKIKVLDIGCGTGNNSWFFAQEGFNITGIDVSDDALNFAKKRFEAENLVGKFIKKTFLEMDSLEEKYDLIVDREALYTQDYTDLKQIMKQIHAKLSDDGVLISFFYNKKNPVKQLYNKSFNNQTFFADDEKNAPFGQRATFLDEKSVCELFNVFEIEIFNHIIEPVKVTTNFFPGMGEYIIIAKKKK